MAKEGCVYIVTNETYESKDLYKIGRSKDVVKRLKKFNTFSPDNLKIIYVYHTHDMEQFENRLHNLLNSFNAKIKGEWYQLNVNQIDSLKGVLSMGAGSEITETIIERFTNARQRIEVEPSGEVRAETDRMRTLSGIFHLRSVNSYMEIKDCKYIVKQGSYAKLKTSATLENGTFKRVLDIRKELIESGVFEREGNLYYINSDLTFDNPSLAANVLLGYWANGRDAWLNQNGMSINEILKSE